MKQFFTIAFVFLFASAQAQPVLTGQGRNPLPNESFVYYAVYNVDTPSQIPSHGPAGANVTWDFHSLQAVDSSNTQYFNCSPAPDCGYFTGSNLTFTDPSTNSWTYYLVDNNQYTYLGSTGNQDADTTFVTGDTLHKYPFTYNDTFRNHAVTITHQNSGQYPGISYDTTNVVQYADAYGTLITPLGTYQNALRVHLILTDVDSSVYASYPTQITYTYQDIYAWYTEGNHTTLLSIDSVYYVPASGPSVSIGQTTYSTSLGTGVKQVSKPALSFSTYPNPAKDLLNIKFYLPTKSATCIILTDAIGKQIATVSNQLLDQGAHELSYNVSALPPGIYLLNIKTGTESITRKIEVL